MDIRNAIREYFIKQKRVLCVYLFGSAMTEKENRFSDVDIAILFEMYAPQEQYSQDSLFIMDDLSRILNKDVDVVELNNATSFLKFQIVKNGFRIYERSDRIEHSFEARVIREYFDFLPVRRKLEMALLNNIKEA